MAVISATLSSISLIHSSTSFILLLIPSSVFFIPLIVSFNSVWLFFIFSNYLFKTSRNSLAVQWLELGAFTAVAQVQSLVVELRSCKLHGMAKKQNFNFSLCASILLPSSLIIFTIVTLNSFSG